jgi:hypothetical protein
MATKGILPTYHQPTIGVEFGNKYVARPGFSEPMTVQLWVRLLSS